MAFLPTSASDHLHPEPEITRIGGQIVIHARFQDFLLISRQFPPINIWIFDPPAVDSSWSARQYEKWFTEVVSIINDCSAKDAVLILAPQDRKGGSWLKSIVSASVIQSLGWQISRRMIWKQTQADYNRSMVPFRDILFFRRGWRPMNDHSPLRYKDMITNLPAPHSPGFAGEIPTELIKLCLSLFYRSGDIIMDPFAGTGSVAAACREMGYTSISVELDREQYSNIVERLRV